MCNNGRKTKRKYVFFFNKEALRPAAPVAHFSKVPNVFAPERPNKISNLMITELFYSRILNMNRGSLHTRILRRIHLFAFRYRLTNRLYAIEKFLGLREMGPRPEPGLLYSESNTVTNWPMRLSINSYHQKFHSS